MDRLTSTPFGPRPVSADQIVEAARALRAPLSGPVDKWALFARLRKAHGSFPVSYRALNVLNALLTFLPGREMGDTAALVVFPSNRSLSERANGMPESTLRRHLAALHAAGLIRRHDSPNGKRYAARGPGGTLAHAFGFDLRPLLERRGEIEAAAEATELAEAEHRRLRERFTLLKRDIAAMAQEADGCHAELEARLAALHRTGRRKLPLPLLRALVDDAAALRAETLARLDTETPDLSGSDAENERHIQTPKEEDLDPDPRPAPEVTAGKDEIALGTVLHACPEAQSYGPAPVRSWRDLADLAQMLRRFVGIETALWHEATGRMGEAGAAVVLCCMVERLPVIRNPGGYLRTLCRKAASGQLSIASMVRALAKPKVDSCQLSPLGAPS